MTHICTNNNVKHEENICVIAIKNVHYYVQGNLKTVTQYARQFNINFDTIHPSKLSANNGIIKIWAIGKLADYLQQGKKNHEEI